MEKSNIPEEVTITPVIRDIERLFLRLFVFVKSAFFYIVNSIASFLRHCFKYFIILALALIIGGIAGYYSTSLIPRKYVSTMVVKLNVDAKAQLFNDVFYVNSLIEKEEFSTLSDLLGITLDEAKTLTGMEVISSTSEVDKLNRLNSFYLGLDSSIRNRFNIIELLNDEENDLGDRFAISVFGTDPVIFSKLEPKFNSFLERVPELQARRKAAIELLNQRKTYYAKQLNDLDTLKKVNNISMLAEAKKTSSTPTTSIALGQQQTSDPSKILNVYNRSKLFFNEKIEIEAKLFDLNSCYKVYAHFSEYGVTVGLGKIKRALIVGGSLFVLMLLITGFLQINSSLRRSNA